MKLLLILFLMSCGYSKEKDTHYIPTPPQEPKKAEEANKSVDDTGMKKPEKPLGPVKDEPIINRGPEGNNGVLVLPGSNIDIPKLDWNNDDWSVHLFIELAKKGFTDLNPRDAGSYCDKYSKLEEGDKLIFWANLMVGISKKESSYDKENLFKLDIANVNVTPYSCGVSNLKDFKENISCATKILYDLVKKDQYINIFVGEWKGGAKYWNTLKVNTISDSLAESTRKFCSSIK